MLRAFAAGLLLMSSGRTGRPPFVEGRPQNDDAVTDVAVATSPPSVTDAPDPAPAAATSSSSTLMDGSATTAIEPEFVYPNSGLTINNVDEIEVEYDTSWAELTLTVTCKGDGVGGSKSFDVTLKEESGNYTLGPVANEFTVSEYPIECSLLLQDQDGVSNFVVGPDFTVTSTGGAPSIYGLSSTRPISGGTTATASGSAASTTGGAGASNTGAGRNPSSTVAADGTEGTPTDVAGASTSDSSSSSDDNGGLSGGAKAGIAIGVLLAVALLGLIIFYFMRTRRRMEAMESELQETKKQHATDTAYVDGILAAAGKPDTRNGGRVVMAEAPARGSGDWKHFFNAKAGAAAAAAAGGTNYGSKTPSRLNTALQAPSSAPPPHSPGMKSSVNGDASSTAGLIQN